MATEPEKLFDGEAAAYPPNSDSEAKSKHLLMDLLDSSFVRGELRIMDKYPNADGILDVTDSDGYIKGKIDVQLKTLPKQYRNNPTYYCEKKFLVYCQDSTLPVILIVVDQHNRKAYWQHMNYELLVDIKSKMTEKGYSLPMPLQNCIDGTSQTYIGQWTQICKSVQEKVAGYDTLKAEHEQVATQLALIEQKFEPITLEPTQIREIQEFLDRYNYLLDSEFRFVKQALYPRYWKIGLGIMRYGAEECSFLVYPVPYGSNEPLIRQVKPGSIKDVGREFALGNILRTHSYSTTNPVRQTPERLAYDLLQSDFEYIIKRVQFELPDDFMANEYIHGFATKFATLFQLEARAESYDLQELRELVVEVLPLLLELKLNIGEGLTRITHDIDSHKDLRPHPNHEKFLADAKARLATGYQAKVEIVPTSELFHLDLLLFYFDHLLQQGNTRSRSVYDPNTRKQSNGGFVWQSWNNEVLALNLDILVQNLKRVYQLLVERHFPGMVKELDLFANGNLILYCLSFEHTIGYGPQLEYYIMQSRAKQPTEVRFCIDTDRPFTRESLIYNKGWTIRINRRVYDLRVSGGEKLAFMFEPLPMHSFTRHLLQEKLAAIIKEKLRHT